MNRPIHSLLAFDKDVPAQLIGFNKPVCTVPYLLQLTLFVEQGMGHELS